MSDSILCQGCGVEAPTKYVEFHQNVGMLIMRQSKVVRANLCKSCIHSRFWKMTGTTLAVGWLGTISIIIAPFFVLNNLVRYLGALGMPAVPPGARPPTINDEEIGRMYPIMGTLFDRLNSGEKVATVARELAPQANVTPGQLVQYAVQLSQAQSRPAAPSQIRTGGFPVVPTTVPPPLPR